MSEKDLNIEYICEKTLLSKDDELVPIILSLIQESYKAGLCQTEFDNTMNLIEENQELKLELSGYRQAILKDKEMLGLKEENQKYKEVIDKAINDLNIIIDIVRELPLGSDCWIIDRLEANKSILKEVE